VQGSGGRAGTLAGVLDAATWSGDSMPPIVPGG
jgi:hypothetical protein